MGATHAEFFSYKRALAYSKCRHFFVDFCYYRVLVSVPGRSYEHIPRAIARYAVDNKAAIAEHQYKNWKAVSVSAHGALSHEYFNTLVRQAGAYRTAESGYQCETNGNFLSIHCLKGGKTTFYMPYKCDAENLFNGKVHKGVTEITVDSEAGSTYWFKLTPAK